MMPGSPSISLTADGVLVQSDIIKHFSNAKPIKPQPRSNSPESKKKSAQEQTGAAEASQTRADDTHAAMASPETTDTTASSTPAAAQAAARAGVEAKATTLSREPAAGAGGGHADGAQEAARAPTEPGARLGMAADAKGGTMGPAAAAVGPMPALSGGPGPDSDPIGARRAVLESIEALNAANARLIQVVWGRRKRESAAGERVRMICKARARRG